MDKEEIFNQAEVRYHKDAEFHALVYKAVRIAVPETVSPSINTALLEVATRSAAIVLLLKERNDSEK